MSSATQMFCVICRAAISRTSHGTSGAFLTEQEATSSNVQPSKCLKRSPFFEWFFEKRAPWSPCVLLQDGSRLPVLSFFTSKLIQRVVSSCPKSPYLRQSVQRSSRSFSSDLSEGCAWRLWVFRCLRMSANKSTAASAMAARMIWTTGSSLGKTQNVVVSLLPDKSR